MSELKRLSLRDNSAVSLISGVADLFLVGLDSQVWPLITVSGPIDLVGPADGEIDMVAVARVDAELQVLTDREPQLANWCGALSERFGDDLGELQPADIAALRAKLTEFSHANVALRSANEVSEREQTAAGDDRLLNWTKRFLTAGVDNAGSVHLDPDHLMDDDFLRIFRLLGESQGFDVVKPAVEPSASISPVDNIALASGIRSRKVNLSDGWNTRTKTPLLGFLVSEGSSAEDPVALLPSRRGYRIQRPGDDRSKPISNAQLAALGPMAYQLYVPLPRSRPATTRDIARISLHGTSSLWLVIIACAVGAAVLALAVPSITNTVISLFVPEGSSSGVVLVGVALVVIGVSSAMLALVQNFATSELTQLAQLRAESALWDRTLDLPLRFFRQHSSGDLSTRLAMVDQLTNLLSSQTVTAILAAVFSLVNFVLLLTYSVPLGVAALVFVAITGYAIVRLTGDVTALTGEQLNAQRQSTAWVVQLITGINKVRVAGAEDRFTALTINVLARGINAQAKSTLVSGKMQAYLAGVGALAPMAFFVIVGTFMWSSTGATISAGTYIAFSVAFGTVLGAIVGLTSAIPAIAMIKPTLALVRPILDSTQTQSVDARPLVTIRGRVELKDIEFQYQPSTPQVLKGLSLTINAGEMTAIVGPSGSGKTSTLRMITGVESPDAGQVLVDGHDLRDIDGNDYRRRIGTVIQGGQLAAGSILDNISGGAELTEDQAWRAADAASIGDEIRAMPMQLQSLVNTNTISGGQAQRILIARALARDPSLLLFDEATSALDNESQNDVMDSVSKLELTRVVIAHRLSTVMNADRILVVADGQLAEEGTYQSLMELDGMFAALAKRQLSA